MNVFPFLSRVIPFVWDHAARFGSRFMKDPRDGAFFLPIVALTVWGPLLFCWAAYRFRTYGFEATTVFVYHFLRLMPRYRMFAYMYVLVHKEGHSRTGFWKWEPLNFGILNYFAGIFYGDCCNSFPMAHNKIHHAYDNDLDDVHTNLDLDRSRAISFLYYVPRFALYWAGITPLVKFAQKRQWTFFWASLFCVGVLCFVLTRFVPAENGVWDGHLLLDLGAVVARVWGLVHSVLCNLSVHRGGDLFRRHLVSVARVVRPA